MPIPLDNQHFPWLTGRSTTVDLASDVRLLRINFEGELGWELYHPIAFQLPLLEALTRAGKAHGLALVGYRAIDALRHGISRGWQRRNNNSTRSAAT